MFSKILGSGKSGRTSDRITSRKSKKGESPYNTLHSRKRSDVEGRIAEDVVMNSAERQLYQHSMATQEQDFGDMLRGHDTGSAFPYASIITQPEETYDARVRRIQHLQPHIQTRKVDLPDFVNVKLFKEVEEFPLTGIFKVPPKGIKATGYDYVNIKRVTFILGPLSSFADSHSDVIVTLMDMRKRTNNVARGLKLQDNKDYRGEFALDYSFPKASIDKISMSFAQEVPTFMVGEQWGACQMYFEIEESTFPITSAFQETIGTIGLSESMMQKYKYNPAFKDLAVRDSHIEQMRDLYLSGDIIDNTEAVSNKVGKTKYAGSSGMALKEQRDKPKRIEVGEGGEVDWSAVRSSKPTYVPQDQISEEPEEDEEAMETEFNKQKRAELIARYKDSQNVTVEERKGILKPTGEVLFQKTARFASASTVGSEASSGDLPVEVGKFANLRLANDQ